MIYTDQEFLYRNSPIGDGTGTILKIKGNSLVFNQLVYLINYSGTVSQIAITQNRSDGRFVATGTASGSFNQNLATHISVIKDHIYLLTSFHQVRPVVSGSGQISLQIYSPSNSAAFQYNIFERDTNNYIFIKSSVTANDVVLRNRFQSGNTYSIDYYPQLFDLSQIFGQTIANQVYTMEQSESGSGLVYFNENFKDYYPLDYYECTSPNLLSFSVPYRPSNISSMTFDITKAVRVHSGTSYEWTFDSFTNATSWRVALTCFDTSGNRIYTGSDISSVSGLTSLPANASSSYYLNGSNNTSLAHGFVSNFDGYIMPFFMLGDTSASSVMNNANIHSLNSGDFNILLSFNGTDLKTQSEDESQSDTLTLPISTYFPTGMKSAGSVYDELTPSKAYTRIGSYTFTGNENFSSQSVGRVYMTTYVPIQAPSNRSTPANMICNNFSVVDDNHIESNSLQISFWNGQIGFCLEKSTSSGSVADLKAYLQSNSTTIYYEMVDANKTEVDISPSLELTYTTYRNGTEQILPVNTSVPTIAPIICDIEYLPIEWIAPIYDRTQEDIINKTPKAYLNIGDMNRIQNDIKFLSAYYNISVLPKTWAYTDIPTVEAFSTILTYLNNIKNKVADSPNLPSNPILTFEQINQIEYFLNFVYEYYRQRIQIISQPVSGCYRAGEPNLLIA